MSQNLGFGGRQCSATGWLGARAAGMAEDQRAEVVYFTRTVTLTSAAAAAGVTIIADSEVPVGFTPYILDFFGKVDGATNWATTANVKLKDNSNVDLATLLVAAMTGNSRIHKGTANVTMEDAMVEGTGGTIGKGLKLIGDANGTGSDFKFTVSGFYQKAVGP